MSGAHVLCLHQNFVTLRQGGNSRAVQMISALLERGCSVDVITGMRSYLDEHVPEPFAKEDALTIARVDVGRSYLRNRGRGYVAFLFGALRAARSLRKPDVVFATSPPLPQLLLGAWLAMRHRVPLVIEIRDLWPAFLVEAGLVRSALMRVALEWIEAFAYRVASRTIALTPAFGAYLERLGTRPLHVIPTGSDPFLATIARIPQERFTLLYAGSLNEVYGLEIVIEAARLRPDVDFVIAGEGRQRDLITRASAELPNLRYAGLLAKDALAPLLARAGAGLVTLEPTPLLETVMPGKLFDYLAAALPVICTVQGHAAKLVRESGGGIVLQKRDAASLAEALATLASMTEEARHAMGERGRAYGLSRFNAVALARQSAAVVANAPADAPVTFAKLIRSAFSALIDVARRRPRKALALFDDQNRERVIDESFARYVPSEEPTTALVIPRILSSRGSA